MLKLQNICFSKNGKNILNNINYEIKEPGVVVITGPNGSGKSTLAKIIMGIEKPTSGEIFFNGENITNLSIDERAKRGISFAFQQPVRFKGITVFDLIKLSAASGKNLVQTTSEGQSVSDDKESNLSEIGVTNNKQDIDFGEACQILSSVGLCAKDYISREIDSSLSGGELKRIEIASIIARKSKLMIFDEPEAGIDLWSFNNLINIFEDLNEKVNGISIIISHQERILKIADNVLLLENGSISYDGAADKVLDNVAGLDKSLDKGCRFKV